jgi:hypothetical protein
MVPRMGVVEIVISCIVGLIGIGLPVAIMVFLYLIYSKVKQIEELLKKE